MVIPRAIGAGQKKKRKVLIIGLVAMINLNIDLLPDMSFPIVAVMTEAARVKPGARVLEIGTGSGYQAAVLAVLAGEVDSIEIVEPLAREAAARLEALGYRNVNVRAGDGYRGWPDRAPFDAILVTAAPPEIPRPLLDQLAVGGRLVAPVGEGTQDLVVVTRTAAGLSQRVLLPVRFVPMTGEAQQRPPGAK
jgi:protein-L-isoaspartate(D-aspartate) O-methyltransferase